MNTVTADGTALKADLFGADAYLDLTPGALMTATWKASATRLLRL